MEKRSLDNLILTDESKFLIGNYTIYGDVTIKNSELIVYGNIFIRGNVVMENSEIIVSDSLNITGSCFKISITATDISAYQLKIYNLSNPYDTIFSITDSDIFVAGNLFSEIKISSNSEITVLGELEIEDDISCHNLLVSGSADCYNIDAILDIYCLIGINCKNLSARDLYTEGGINCNNGEIHINGQIYAEGGIVDCSYLSVRR